MLSTWLRRRSAFDRSSLTNPHVLQPSSRTRAAAGGVQKLAHGYDDTARGTRGRRATCVCSVCSDAGVIVKQQRLHLGSSPRAVESPIVSDLGGATTSRSSTSKAVAQPPMPSPPPPPLPPPQPCPSQRTRLTSVPHPTQNQQTPTKCDAGEFQSQTATEITIGRRRVLAGDRQRRQCRPAPADITGPGSAIPAGIAEPMIVHTPAVQPSCRMRGRDHQFDRRSSCDRHRQGIDRQQLQRLQHLVVRLRTE